MPFDATPQDTRLSDVALVLKEARRLIDHPSKWTKRQARGGYGQRCLSAALHDAAVTVGMYLQWWDQADLCNTSHHAVMRQLYPYTSIPGFNDLCSTTHADVMCVLDAAIDYELHPPKRRIDGGMHAYGLV